MKIVAIKLVVFLSFWQASAISVGTSTLDIVHPNKVLAYPDIKVGIPALLLCIEMALFALLHIWAFPYAPYKMHAPVVYYPSADFDKGGSTDIENEREPKSGGLVGLSAVFDALNVWDIVKAFGRGMRWLFCGVRRRKEDISYRLGHNDTADSGATEMKSTDASTYGAMRQNGNMTQQQHPALRDESIGLMAHAQPNPANSRGPSRSPQGRSDNYLTHARKNSNYAPPAQTHTVQSSYDEETYAYSNTSLPRHGQQDNEEGMIGQAIWEPMPAPERR